MDGSGGGEELTEHALARVDLVGGWRCWFKSLELRIDEKGGYSVDSVVDVVGLQADR